jgi:hypothetical protein
MTSLGAVSSDMTSLLINLSVLKYPTRMFYGITSLLALSFTQFLLGISEIGNTNVGPEVTYPDKCIMSFLYFPKNASLDFKSGHGQFLPHPSQHIVDQ